jgi:hypothetical protein
MQPARSVCWFHPSRYFLLVSLLAVAFYPQSARAETKVIADADKGSEIRLKVGDTLEVRLKSNPTTGYMWYVHKESTPLLKLDHQSETEPEGPVSAGRSCRCSRLNPVAREMELFCSTTSAPGRSRTPTKSDSLCMS